MSLARCLNAQAFCCARRLIASGVMFLTMPYSRREYKDAQLESPIKFAVSLGKWHSQSYVSKLRASQVNSHNSS